MEDLFGLNGLNCSTVVRYAVLCYTLVHAFNLSAN